MIFRQLNTLHVGYQCLSITPSLYLFWWQFNLLEPFHYCINMTLYLVSSSCTWLNQFTRDIYNWLQIPVNTSKLNPAMFLNQWKTTITVPFALPGRISRFYWPFLYHCCLPWRMGWNHSAVLWCPLRAPPRLWTSLPGSPFQHRNPAQGWP